MEKQATGHPLTFPRSFYLNRKWTLHFWAQLNVWTSFILYMGLFPWRRTLERKLWGVCSSSGMAIHSCLVTLHHFRSYATTNRWWYRTWDDLSILSIPNQSVANRDLQTNKERSTNKGLSTFPLSIPQQCSVSLSEQLGDITNQHEFEQCLIYRIPSFHNYLIWGSEGLYPCWKHICRLGLHLNKLTWFPIPLVGWEPLGPSPSWFTGCWFECRLECWLECSMGT